MKDVKKIYGNFNILERNHENQLTKVTYSSLDKYSDSPYLQRVAQHSFKKNIKRQATPIKAAQSQELKKEEQHNQKTFLPKLVTPAKYTEGQVISYFKTEHQHQTSLEKHKQSVGTHSATLEVNNSKKKKLQPLNKTHKIHFVTKTKAGTTGKQQKINQDIAIIETKFPFEIKLFAVCDGHGVNGHLVSAFIKVNFLKNLHSAFKKLTSSPTIQQFKTTVSSVIQKTNQQLLESDINTQLSGSTFIAVFLFNNRIITFNVGDSRAILGCQQAKVSQQSSEASKTQQNSKANALISKELSFKKSIFEWKVVELSSDHKPDREDQRKRVINAGGRIFSQKNQKGEDLGPLRVWMKELMMPGLAMTRSLGDKAGIKAGTVAQPEILQFEMIPEYKFIVVASDGIWEYLQNQEVLNLIVPLYMKDDLDFAAQRLVKIATQVWQKVSFSRDDITAVIVSLNSPLA